MAAVRSTSSEVAELVSDEAVQGVHYKVDQRISACSDSDGEISGEGNVDLGLTCETINKGDSYYTVEDAVNKMGFGPFQILMTFFCGMLWMSDAMELMVLSVLSPLVRCEWGLNKVQEAMITTIVFIGFFFGGFFWGWLADVIGRRTTLLILNIEVIVFALASAAAPSYTWLLVFRFGAGFGVSGTALAVTYYVEFLPSRCRGVCVILIQGWWAIGSIFAALLAMIIIPRVDTIGWRVYLGVCSVPLILDMVFFLLVPESARYFLSHGKQAKAEKVMARVARYNFKTLPKGKLVIQEEKEKRDALKDDSADHEMEEPCKQEDNAAGSPHQSDSEGMPLLDEDELTQSEGEENPKANIQMAQPQTKPWHNKERILEFARYQLEQLAKLFKSGMWRTTLLLVLIWFASGYLYYGAVLLTATVLQYDPHCGINTTINDTQCVELDNGFYAKLVWTTLAEFPGIIGTLLVIDFIGRKWTMAIEFLGSGIFYGLLFVCSGEVMLTIFLFGIRACATGYFQVVFVYTPEVYPTAVRGAAMGLTTSSARIGALLTPFVAQVLFHASDYAAISLYTGVSLLMVVVTLLLPIETKGRSLKDSKGGH